MPPHRSVSIRVSTAQISVAEQLEERREEAGNLAVFSSLFSRARSPIDFFLLSEQGVSKVLWYLDLKIKAMEELKEHVEENEVSVLNEDDDEYDSEDDVDEGEDDEDDDEDEDDDDENDNDDEKDDDDAPEGGGDDDEEEEGGGGDGERGGDPDDDDDDDDDEDDDDDDEEREEEVIDLDLLH